MLLACGKETNIPQIDSMPISMLEDNPIRINYEAINEDQKKFLSPLFTSNSIDNQDLVHGEKYRIEYKSVLVDINQIGSLVKISEPQPLKNIYSVIKYKHFLIAISKYKGIHIIDNSNPASPINFKFIEFPFESEVIIENDILFLYSSSMFFKFSTNLLSSLNLLEAIKLDCNTNSPSSAPKNQMAIGYEYKYYKSSTNQLVKKEFSFGFYNYNFSSSYEFDYDSSLKYDISNNIKGTNITLTSGSNVSNNTFSTSAIGSTSKICIAKNILYVLDMGYVYTVDLRNSSMQLLDCMPSRGFETLHPNGDYLYIGANNGMYIYHIKNAKPEFISVYQHIQSCDPVVVEGNLAYLTLRSGTRCMNQINQLEIIDIADKSNPKVLRTYPMSNPYGLALTSEHLYICDGEEGLKIFPRVPNSWDIKAKDFTQAKSVWLKDLIITGNQIMTYNINHIYQFELRGSVFSKVSEL
jgi:hypothetical protein